MTTQAPLIAGQRPARIRGLGSDLLLLSGALLASAALGYVEHRHHLLGTHWTQHFLLLAAFHGATAYLLGSRLVLALALTSFAAWIGADTTFSYFLPLSRANLEGTGWSCLCGTAVFVGCRWLHVRRVSLRREFIGVYEGFAVHLAGIGALLLMLPGYIDRPMPGMPLLRGTVVMMAVVAVVGVIGWRRRQAAFMRAALAYAIAGAWRLEFWLLDGMLALIAASLATLVVGAVLVWRVPGKSATG